MNPNYRPAAPGGRSQREGADGSAGTQQRQLHRDSGGGEAAAQACVTPPWGCSSSPSRRCFLMLGMDMCAACATAGGHGSMGAGDPGLLKDAAPQCGSSRCMCLVRLQEGDITGVPRSVLGWKQNLQNRCTAGAASCAGRQRGSRRRHRAPWQQEAARRAVVLLSQALRQRLPGNRWCCLEPCHQSGPPQQQRRARRAP